MEKEYFLEMLGIVKQYPGVTALKGVDFRVERNTIHCLVGENGAGKSTLIKILTCAERMTQGKILLDGEEFTGKSVKDAMNAGISTLFQELNVIDQLTVEENLTLGRERHAYGVIQKNGDDAFVMLEEFAPDIALKRRVSTLSFAQKQVVEIVKAISADARLVIMDEPTAALSRVESEQLYDVVRKLKAKGITVIYISHVLDDIFTIGDNVTVLRDGEIAGTHPVAQTTRTELVEMMVGRVVHSGYSSDGRKPDVPLLQADDLTTSSVRNISFTLHRGEILGFYGLRGAGKSETARALFGLDRLAGGRILIGEKPVSVKNPMQAMRHGIAMVPEERLTEGLFMKLSISDNIAITNYRNTSHWGVVNGKSKGRIARKFVDDLNIKTHSIEQHAGTLSGGNQQKVVIAKCLNAKTKLLLLDEPSRGIDVGAKEEIYAIVRRLAGEGVGILVFSSEYDEIVALCDRVVLMASGRVISILPHEELDSQRVHMLTMDKGATT